MLLRALTSHHICFSEASKPFLIWACSIRQTHVLGDAQAAAAASDNVRSFLDDDRPAEKKITRSCYVPHPDVVARSEEEIMKFRNENEMKIKGRRPCPRPVFTLEEANFPGYIMEKFRRQNFKEPTPIQSQSWPIALQGENMVGIARTGSGKTLAYIVPSIIRIHEEKRENSKTRGPFSLVVAPTRELALQIQSVSAMFKDTVNSVAVYGGSSRINQENLLMDRPDIVIATPGRLLDFLRAQVINLNQCSYIVLDEADRMLDMGFEPQIREIMDQTESDKQVLMWSATWPKEIRSLAEDYLNDYIHVTVGSEELTANPNITQILKFCTPYDKVFNLIEFLKSTGQAKSLIFTESKRMADNVKDILYKKGFKSSALHGDKSQLARETILRDFRSGRTQILIATEIAARGLDVNDVEYVINFDLPKTIDSYIHRIGRTARHEKKGTAFSLVTELDKPVSKDLMDVLTQCNQEVPEQLRVLAQGSVRINFRERYAARAGEDNWNKKRFNRSDSWSPRENRNQFQGSWSQRGDRNQFQSRRRNYDDDDSGRDSFEFGGERPRGFRGQQRRSRDDDLW